MTQEEYVWSATLDKNAPEVTWCPLSAEDEDMIHKLHIRNAFLTSKSKKDDELHLITLETMGLKEEAVKCPLVMFRGSSKPQISIGQCFNREVKLSLTEGTGPLVLVGSHVLEAGSEKENSEENDNEMLYGEASEGEDTDVEEQEEEEQEEEEQEEEQEDEEMTEEEEESPVKPKKPTRKNLPNGVKNGGKKRKAIEDDEEDCEDSPKESSKRKVNKKQKVIETTNGAKSKSKKSNK